MRSSYLNIFFAATFLLSCSLFVSCDKVNVNFGNVDPTGDPAITFFQDYHVALQTLQVDSFLTSGEGIFTVGYHQDPVFGTIHAGSYAQLEIPANPILNLTTVTYDSLEVILRPKADYYGDSTSKFYIRLYQLTEPIQNVVLANTNFYNSRSFNYNTTPLNYYPNQYIIDSPSVANNKSIRIVDAVGLDLFNKFKTGAVQISTQTDFINYFKGFYIDVDNSQTKSLFTFNSAADSVMMRLHYTQHGLTNVAKSIDFTYTFPNQFNHIDYNRTGTPLSAFPAFVNNKATLSSTATGNKAYLNSSSGTYIKISFPDILNLKTLHPFIKVVSAQLVVPPSPGSYAYPYKLPPAVYLYETDKNNGIIDAVVDAGGSSQTGNLFIDNLSGESTQYTYDITNFITTLLSQGVSSTSALLLSPSPTLGDQTLTRLIINDQNLLKGIQLKLYVLGI